MSLARGAGVLAAVLVPQVWSPFLGVRGARSWGRQTARRDPEAARRVYCVSFPRRRAEELARRASEISRSFAVAGSWRKQKRESWRRGVQHGSPSFLRLSQEVGRRGAFAETPQDAKPRSSAKRCVRTSVPTSPLRATVLPG